MATDARPKLITRREAAEILRLKENTLARWAMDGRHLKTYHIGARIVRYREDEVFELLRRQSSSQESL